MEEELSKVPALDQTTTSPPTCMKRTYNLPDMFEIFRPKPPEKTPVEIADEERKKRVKTFCSKTPKELLTPKLPESKRRAFSAKPKSSASSRSIPRPPSAPANRRM
jgi:hypothetical protein